MAITEGADFPESVKLQAKKLAAFRCCMCHTRFGDEVHHVVPKAESGTNDLDNAVLLCAQCHSDNGSRPERRKVIRQVRDWWYEQVRARYKPENIGLLVQLDQIVTKEDFDGMKRGLITAVESLIASVRQGSTSPAEVVNAASTMVSSISSPPVYVGPTAYVPSVAKCERCGAILSFGATGYECFNCKHRSG